MLTTSWKLVLLASLSVLHVSARGYKPTPTKPTPCPPSTTTTTTAPPPVTTPVPPECDIQVIYADPSCVDNANPSIECPAMTTTNGDCERNAVIRYRIQNVGDHPLVITSLINEIEVDGDARFPPPQAGIIGTTLNPRQQTNLISYVTIPFDICDSSRSETEIRHTVDVLGQVLTATGLPGSDTCDSRGQITEAVPHRQEPPSEPPSPMPSRMPSSVPTSTPSNTPTRTPTASPVAVPTSTPSTSPSETPTASPSESPTLTPSTSPSKTPTASPSESPSKTPTASPSESPTLTPSESPSETPTASPSTSPTFAPSESPSAAPTETCTVRAGIDCTVQVVINGVPENRPCSDPELRTDWDPCVTGPATTTVIYTATNTDIDDIIVNSAQIEVEFLENCIPDARDEIPLPGPLVPGQSYDLVVQTCSWNLCPEDAMITLSLLVNARPVARGTGCDDRATEIDDPLRRTSGAPHPSPSPPPPSKGSFKGKGKGDSFKGKGKGGSFKGKGSGSSKAPKSPSFKGTKGGDSSKGSNKGGSTKGGSTKGSSYKGFSSSKAPSSKGKGGSSKGKGGSSSKGGSSKGKGGRHVRHV